MRPESNDKDLEAVTLMMQLMIDMSIRPNLRVKIVSRGVEFVFYSPHNEDLNAFSRRRLKKAITEGRTVQQIVFTANREEPWIFLPEAPHDDRRAR